MKKILTSFLVALSLVAISAFDTSLSTNTSSLQTKQNTLTIMSKAEAAEISEGVAAPDFAFTDLATGRPLKLSHLRDISELLGHLVSSLREGAPPYSSQIRAI